MIIKVPQTTFASFEVSKFWTIVNEKLAVELLTNGLVGNDENPIELYLEQKVAMEQQMGKDARTRSFLAIEIDPAELDTGKISAYSDGVLFNYRGTIGLKSFIKVTSITREVTPKEVKTKSEGGKRRKAVAQ
jgi:hypothetical protein